MNYIGIDAHKKYCYIYVSDKEGNCIEEGQVETRSKSLLDFLSRYKNEESKAVLESTYNWHYVYDEVKKVITNCVLAHPKGVKAIAYAKVKTDKADAKMLAHLLRSNLIPESYVSEWPERLLKDRLRHRMGLIGLRTKLKNKIHVLIARYGFNHGYSDLFTKVGIQWLSALTLDQVHKDILEQSLRHIDELNKSIKQIERDLAKDFKKNEDIQLLTSIPGIGLLSAYFLKSEIGDIKRFPTKKHLASYAGLVPGIHSSAESSYTYQSKDRNKYLNWVLVEAAYPAIRNSHILNSKYDTLKQRKNSNKAKYTVARKLSEAVFKVLTYKQPYEEGITLGASNRAPSMCV